MMSTLQVNQWAVVTCNHPFHASILKNMCSQGHQQGNNELLAHDKEQCKHL